MAPQSVLIVGGSKGLGKALVDKYASMIDPQNVHVTVRGNEAEGMPKGERDRLLKPLNLSTLRGLSVSADLVSRSQSRSGVKIITGIDCSKSDVGEKIVKGLQGTAIEVVVYVAGVMTSEVRVPFQLLSRPIESAY